MGPCGNKTRERTISSHGGQEGYVKLCSKSKVDKRTMVLSRNKASGQRDYGTM